MKTLALLLVLLTPGLAAAQQTGTYIKLHEDRLDGTGRYHDYVQLDAPQAARRSPTPRPPVKVAKPAFTLNTGDRVEVQRGRILPAPTAQGLRQTVLATVQPGTFGPQRTLIMLVNFADNPGLRPWTVASMQAMLTDPVDGFSAVYSAMSYGQTSLTGDAAGWFTLPMSSATCDYWAIAGQADLSARAQGINLDAYPRLVYLFPVMNSCAWAGLGTIGGNPSSRTWINGHLSAFVHELGHNLRLYHSHALRCADVLTTGCTVSEYGDHTDRMGGGGHFNPYQKQRLGWLGFGASPPITTVTTSGIYPLAVYDLPGSQPKALQIARGSTGQTFYVSFRRLVRWESAAGVFVHMARATDPNSSELLDMTPGGSTMQSDGNLAPGQVFLDPVSKISIKTVSVEPERVQIQVIVGGVAPPNPLAPPAGVSGSPTFTLTWVPPDAPAAPTGYQVERGAAEAGAFTALAATTATTYLDSGSHDPGTRYCYRVKASYSSGTSGPSNVACIVAPPTPPGTVTLTITGSSSVGREMTFRGTLTGSTTLTATLDGRPIEARYVVVDRVRKTWTAKVSGLFPGPHVFAVASGTATARAAFTVAK